MSEPTTAEAIKLGVAQILLESIDFRHRGDPLAMPVDARPPATPAEVQVHIRMAENEKSAAVRVRVKSEAEEAPYFYDAVYLVVLSFDAPVTEELKDRLIVTGGNMALPFIREVVANLSGRGRYGPTWLAPVDFTAMVAKRSSARLAGASS